MVNRFHSILPFLMLVLNAYASTQAQVRKAALSTRAEVPFTCEIPVFQSSPSQTGEILQETDCLLFVEHQPEFPGGTNAMSKFVKANLKMPLQAKATRISGRVFISFVIEKTGEITHATVLKGLGFGCDSEAMRLVKSMPKWKPGRQNGQSVRVRYTLPIFFEPK